MLPLAPVVAALVLLAAPDARPLPPAGQVNGATALQLHSRGVAVLDVRTPLEFEAGHVPGALNIPFDQVAARTAELGAKDKPLLVYCRSGRRSGVAAAELIKQGFTAVYDFKSISDWPGPVEIGAAKAR
jgi:phage shock protein E